MTRCMTVAAATISLLAAFPVPGIAEVTPVTVCNQSVLFGQLMNDLDCTAVPGPALFIQPGGAVVLNGHTIKAETTGNEPAIWCAGSCRIAGPGTIEGGFAGVQIMHYSGDGRSRLAVGAVTVTGSSYAGLLVDYEDEIVIRNSTIENNTRYAALSQLGRLRMSDSTVRNNGTGIRAFKMRVDSSTITDNNVATPEPFGGMGTGVTAHKVRIEDSIITGNMPNPAQPGSICELRGCSDIRTGDKPPKLKNVVCETSVQHTDYVIVFESSWNLCSNDADFDQDGVANEDDVCRSNETCNAGDADGDGFGDCCDNCVATANTDQTDFDKDGLGDACD